MQFVYEDSMDLIAKLPCVAAKIYRNLYREGSSIGAIDSNLDWSHNFTNMLGYSDTQFKELMRLYLTIHRWWPTNSLTRSSQTPPPLVHSRQSLGMRSSWTFNLCNCPQKISNLYEESRFLPQPQGEKHISEACFQPCWETWMHLMSVIKLDLSGHKCNTANWLFVEELLLSEPKKKVKSIGVNLNANNLLPMLNPAWQVNSV